MRSVKRITGIDDCVEVIVQWKGSKCRGFAGISKRKSIGCRVERSSVDKVMGVMLMMLKC